MKNSGTIASLALPLKAWAPRFGFILLTLTAFVLMLLSKAETVVLERARSQVVDAVAPALDVLSRPAASVQNSIDFVNGLVLLHSENVRLRAENEKLLRWQALAQNLQSENATLRAELGYVTDREPRFITARVVADTGGSFVQSVLINAGSEQNVRRGQAAMSQEGIAGRVSTVGSHSSRLLLLTDLNSRVPVIVESTGNRGILAGNNGPRPTLQYLPTNTPVSAGDRVVTSGDGGVFPPGLPVGVVSQAGVRGIQVEPIVDFTRMGVVRVLDFGPAGMLPLPEERALR